MLVLLGTAGASLTRPQVSLGVGNTSMPCMWGGEGGREEGGREREKERVGKRYSTYTTQKSYTAAQRTQHTYLIRARRNIEGTVIIRCIRVCIKLQHIISLQNLPRWSKDKRGRRSFALLRYDTLSTNETNYLLLVSSKTERLSRGWGEPRQSNWRPTSSFAPSRSLLLYHKPLSLAVDCKRTVRWSFECTVD